MKHTHYWKIGLAALGFVALWLALTVATQAAEEDLDPPHLVSLDFAPQTVDTSDADQTITFTARITDDLSGVNRVWVHLHSPSWAQSNHIYYTSGDLKSGDTLDGIYVGSIVLPRYSETGIWRIYAIELSDKVTNRRWLNETDLITMSFTTQLTVTGTISDVTPPQLVNFDFEPKTVDTSGTALLPRTLTFTAHVTADLSGVDSVGIRLMSPSGEQKYYPSLDLETGNALDGIYRDSFTFPPYSETGVWKVGQVSLHDKVTNSRYAYEAELSALGFPTQFTVTAPISDTEPPHLATFDFEPKVVDTARMSQTITFTARITDNLAGVDYWYFRYHSPSGQYMPTMHQTSILTGDPLDRTYGESVILPQYSEMGIWTLSHISMYDLAGNRDSLSAEEVIAMGFPTDTTRFLNGTPIPTDTQSTLIYPSPDGLTTTLDVPAGAVTDTTYLAYNNVSEVTDVPQGHTFAGRAFSLDAYRDMALLSDFRFARPPTVTLAYDGAVVSGTRESNLLLAYWDGDTWVDIVDSCPGAVYVRHPEQDQLSVPICHLSQFALLSAPERRPVYIPLVLRE